MRVTWEMIMRRIDTLQEYGYGIAYILESVGDANIIHILRDGHVMSSTLMSESPNGHWGWLKKSFPTLAPWRQLVCGQDYDKSKKALNLH